MSMKIEFDDETLRPLIHRVVAEAWDRVEEERARLQGRMAFTEAEVAALLGVKQHVVRDCRRRGEIEGSRVGSKIMYTREDIKEFLERGKENH